MKQLLPTVVLVGLCVVLLDGTAAAQGALVGRLSFHFNGAYQPTGRTSEETVEFEAYQETGKLNIMRSAEGGGAFDGGGLLQVWRELAVGATYSQMQSTADASFDGTVPHPLFFSDRPVGTQMLSSKYRERATHIHVAWAIPVSSVDGLDVTITGGPTFFNVTRGLPTRITLVEGAPPFNDVLLTAQPEELTSGGWGAHVGADVAYMLTPTFGLGGVVRFAAGSVDTFSESDDGGIGVGGVQIGGGLRLRF